MLHYDLPCNKGSFVEDLGIRTGRRRIEIDCDVTRVSACFYIETLTFIVLLVLCLAERPRRFLQKKMKIYECVW